MSRSWARRRATIVRPGTLTRPPWCSLPQASPPSSGGCESSRLLIVRYASDHRRHLERGHAAYQRGVEALHTSLDHSLVRHFAPSRESASGSACLLAGALKRTRLHGGGSGPWHGWCGPDYSKSASLCPWTTQGVPTIRGTWCLVSSQGRYPLQRRRQYHCLSGLRE